MEDEVMERLILAFERIADALGDMCVIQKRRLDRDFPERREPRDAVITRIKTEEDIIKERQGAGDEPIREWFGGYEDQGFIGERERAFLEEQKLNTGTQAGNESGQSETGSKASRGRPRGSKNSSRVNSPPEIG